MFIKSKWGPVYHNLDLSMSLLFHPSREGEFTVEVLAFNNISSAVLRKPLFIVHEPCQPPPVKNMGPKKVQVGLFWRNHPTGLAMGCFQTAELAGEWRGLCWVCPAVFSTMKSLWGLWSGVPKQGKPGLGGRPGFYWVNKSFIYLYDWRWAQLALSSFFLFFLFWLYTEWWHFQSKGKSTPKWKEMTNYMLSTKYRAEKKFRLPFISSTPLRALISSSFTFRSKVFSLTLGNQNSLLSICQNTFSDGSAANPVLLRSQQPQSAVDFKESMGLPWAGCGFQVSMSLEARPL